MGNYGAQKKLEVTCPARRWACNEVQSPPLLLMSLRNALQKRVTDRLKKIKKIKIKPIFRRTSPERPDRAERGCPTRQKRMRRSRAPIGANARELNTARSLESADRRERGRGRARASRGPIGPNAAGVEKKKIKNKKV